MRASYRLRQMGSLFGLEKMSTSPPAPPALQPSQAGTVKGQGPAKLHLYTAATPNGYKVSILLEELREAYPELARGELSYDVCAIDIASNAQKHPDYLKINPNGRIPALVDDNAGGLDVWESASVELWLVEQYDKEFKLSFHDPKERSQALSWIFFAHGGVGPMQGQSHHFFRYAPIKIPYGIKRYKEETERLYSVLESGLASSDWLVGHKYSVADINVYPWVRSAIWAGVDLADFPKLKAWVDRIGSREAVKKGLSVPNSPRDMGEIVDKSKSEVKEWIDKAEAELKALKK